MPGQSSVGWIDIIVILAYLFATGYLGWLGYRGTRSAADFLVGGRSAHPIIMAVSYGATFISTAAIVGFGGVAGLFGMSLLWLTFLNIGVGILIAFVLFGEPTRRLGHHLGAHTFPELLGLRYQSRGVQIFAGVLIFLFMPLYAAAVMTGGSIFAATQFGIDFEVALLIFALITAAYVIPGGLKAVMYTDTFQGFVMVLAMIFLLVFTYSSLGGITEAHRSLTDMADMVPAPLANMGHQGWTAMPAFGWGASKYDLWWTVVTAIILGVGIGVLAQPQLAVRFMTVRSRRELDRAVPIGAVFIMLMTGTPFLVGSLSNAWFAQHGPILNGRVVQEIDAEKGRALVELMQPGEAGGWRPILNPKTQAPATAALILSERKQAQNAAGETFELVGGRSSAVTYVKGDADKIIPTFISAALPHWFGVVFFLALLAAAMSTMSSQFHTIGTAAGRDLYERFGDKGKSREPSLLVMRLAIVLGLLVAVTISYTLRLHSPRRKTTMKLSSSRPEQGLRLGLATLLSAAICLSPALAADEGLYIETLNRSTGLMGETPSEDISKTYVAHGKMKVTSANPQGTDMILDPASGDMAFLNHTNKEYYQLNTKSMMEGMSQPGIEQMRAMMEQNKISVTATDETRKINDWNCRKYQIKKTGMMEIDQEIWATEDVDLDLKRYTELMSMSGPEALLGDSPAAQAQRAEMDKIKGYPILTKSKMQMMGTTIETESEVTVIRKEPMAADLFVIPADYQLKEMGRAPAASGGHP